MAKIVLSIKDEFTKALSDYARGMDKSSDESKGFSDELGKVSQALGVLGAATDETAKTQNKLNAAMLNAKQAASALSTAQSDLKNNTDPKKQDELARAVANAQVSLDKAGNEVVDLTSKLRDASTESKKLSDGLDSQNKKVAEFAKGMAAAAATALVAFGAASLKAASDAEESTSKFNAVFKDQAGQTEKTLEEMAGTINRSKFDLMAYAATLQDTFVPLGFARDQAADMSVQVVQLAEDLASFNNLRTEDVVRDLQSALVGNTETLRKYGVVAQETQIKAKAMELGWWDGTGAIDAQTKANVILRLALEGTSDAQGDAARTADSFANQMKGMEATTKELQVAIGQLLLPAAKEFITLMREGTSVLTQIVRWNEVVADAVNKHGDEVVLASDSYTEYTAEVRRAAGAAGLIDKQFGILSPSVRVLTKEEYDLARATNKTEQALQQFSWAAGPVAENLTALTTLGYGTHAPLQGLTTDLQTLADTQNTLAYGMGPLADENKKYGETQKDLGDQAYWLKVKIEQLQAQQGKQVTYNQKSTLSANELNLAQLKLADAQTKLSETADPLKQAQLQVEIDKLQGKISGATGAVSGYIDNSKKIGELQGQYDGINAEIEANAKAHEEASKRIVFSILQQQLATDGFTQQEAGALLDLATKWGFIDQAAAAAGKGVIDAVGSAAASGNWDALGGQIDDITARLLGIPTRREILISIREERSTEPGQSTGTVGGAIGDGQAVGGAVVAGRPTKLHKDEIFVPQTGGYVMTKQEAQAAMSFGNINVDARGSTLSAAAIRAAVKAALDEAGRSSDAYRRTGGVN